jgi:hypothetical protein
MHEDDEERFPRLNLWQLITGLFRWSRNADKFLDGRWVSDIASLDATAKRTSGPDTEKELSSRGSAAEPGIHKR